MRLKFLLDYYINNGEDLTSFEFKMEVPKENEEDFKKFLDGMDDLDAIDIEEVSDDESAS